MSDDQIRRIEKQLQRIEDALVGDTDMGLIGLVQEVRDIKKTVAEIQRERLVEQSEKQGMWKVIAAAGTVGGAVGGLITWLSGILHALPKP